MSAAVDLTLAEAIRKEYAAADAEGRTRPGRPALIEKLANPPEISGHQVRKAKDLVDAEDASPPAPPTSEPPDASDHQPSTSRPLVLWPVNTAHRLAAVTERMTAALETAETPAPTPAASQPSAKTPRPWPLAFIGLAAAVAVWSGWVGLGEMAGFGPVNLLPGIGTGWTINSAVVLPLSVEAYAAYALRVWLATSRHSHRTITFASRSTITSLVVGGAAQVVYHLLSASGYTKAPWPVTMLVSLVPVLVLGLASALAKLVANDRQAGASQ
ncbi:MAG TPA: hypothetical protein VIQ30_13560 [Pseudonocardia sp.]